MVKRPFIDMPPILSSPAQVQESPSTLAVDSVNSPRLLNSRSVYVFSSLEKPITERPDALPIELLKSAWQTTKNPPSINSHVSVSLILPPAPIGPGFN